MAKRKRGRRNTISNLQRYESCMDFVRLFQNGGLKLEVKKLQTKNKTK